MSCARTDEAPPSRHRRGCLPEPLWNPQDLGTLATYAAAALAKGEITGKEGDTFTAGELGEFTVGANATVLLGEPYKFNKDNIDQFNF